MIESLTTMPASPNSPIGVGSNPRPSYSNPCRFAVSARSG